MGKAAGPPQIPLASLSLAPRRDRSLNLSFPSLFAPPLGLSPLFAYCSPSLTLIPSPLSSLGVSPSSACSPLAAFIHRSGCERSSHAGVGEGGQKVGGSTRRACKGGAQGREVE